MAGNTDRKTRFLYFDEISRYLESTENSRNLREGECVLNGGLIISCGFLKRCHNELQVIGLCLQTSGLTKDPHQVTGSINTEEENLQVKDFKCTCKAGESGKCKHTAAILLYLNRNDVMSLEDMSVTDLTCLWSKLKVPSLQMYAPVPMQEFCHIKKNCRPALPKAFLEEARLKLQAACPESALTKHMMGRLMSRPTGTGIPTNEDTDQRARQESLGFVQALFKHSRTTTEGQGIGPLLELPAQDLQELDDCCANSYSDLLLLNEQQAILLCHESATERKKWDEARQFRITGSRCYSIFTYGSSKKIVDWPNKASKYFWPTPFTSKFTEHGIFFESHARNVYKSFMNLDVMEVGLFVCVKHPWLAYSADGIVCENGLPTRLLEIKCPMIGKQTTAQDLVDSLPYIVYNSQKCSFELKKKHQYYGQVQLGMCVLNLKTCDFVLYSSFDNTIQVISVGYDEGFVKKLLAKLKINYFMNMIHEICKNKSGLGPGSELKS